MCYLSHRRVNMCGECEDFQREGFLQRKQNWRSGMKVLPSEVDSWEVRSKGKVEHWWKFGFFFIIKGGKKREMDAEES